MAESFFFYDVETSGFNPRSARIMQFAGQRTDLSLKPIGEPLNVLIKMTDDVLPDPQAILVTGITPQQTLKAGITEAEFLKKFHELTATPGTIFVGYNTVRFDDEFMRYLHYRNFYDPYEWQWKDERSKWDLLDMVRMTRALRPEGIKWPFDSEGRPSNRLELLAAVNKLKHENAHDALGDVQATIEVARLIRAKQPRLFDFLLSLRDKRSVAELVLGGQPFVYTSGKYPGEFEKTSVVVRLTDDISGQGALVYDLHFDPDDFTGLTPKGLAELWRWQKDPEAKRLPVKTIKFNRCPAVAPLGVLDATSQKRIKLNQKTWEAHQAKLHAAENFPANIRKAQELMEKRRQTRLAVDEHDVDAQLYDGFFDDHDRRELPTLRTAKPAQLTELANRLHDHRLKALVPLYKARNFPNTLTVAEQKAWQTYRAQKLLTGDESSELAIYEAQIEQLIKNDNLSDRQLKLLKELRIYARDIVSPDVMSFDKKQRSNQPIANKSHSAS